MITVIGLGVAQGDLSGRGEKAILAAKMLMESGKHPGELKDAVCSPGGTTIAGVHALENGAFRASSIEAVTAAYEKTLQLKK